MSENEERYVLEIDTGIVILIDTKTGVRDGFMGEDRLALATARKAVLEAEALAFGGQITQEDVDATMAEAVADAEEFQESPAGFLAGLNDFARRQRLTVMIGEVQAVEDQLLLLLAEDSRLLARATGLRQRLRKALASLPGSPESAQQAPPGGQDDSAPLSASELDAWRQHVVDTGLNRLSQPGPY